ncbi:hypothetical protein L2E82_42927 [Cichorium intybus]|uniref:Uncharacterized protein n=1 Tax=Cichorium intybus TaxID=13427 RepID=A0ACB8ZN04_CICIN|nr:hypothetical protein L2E82_42927 [Cichorium intybus]
MELGLAVFILSLPFLSITAQSIRFEIESGQAKCLSEEIRINSMTVGEYSVVNPNEGHPLPEHHKIIVALFSGSEKRYHHAELVESGHFALQVEEEGKHMLCFKANTHEPAVNTTVEFNWRSGVTAKGWSNVATKDSVDRTKDARANQVYELHYGVYEFVFIVYLLVCGGIATMAS